MGAARGHVDWRFWLNNALCPPQGHCNCGGGGGGGRVGARACLGLQRVFATCCRCLLASKACEVDQLRRLTHAWLDASQRTPSVSHGLTARAGMCLAASCFRVLGASVRSCCFVSAGTSHLPRATPTQPRRDCAGPGSRQRPCDNNPGSGPCSACALPAPCLGSPPVLGLSASTCLHSVLALLLPHPHQHQPLGHLAREHPLAASAFARRHHTLAMPGPFTRRDAGLFCLPSAICMAGLEGMGACVCFAACCADCCVCAPGRCTCSWGSGGGGWQDCSGSSAGRRLASCSHPATPGQPQLLEQCRHCIYR